jgi:hypothetical protein
MNFLGSAFNAAKENAKKVVAEGRNLLEEVDNNAGTFLTGEDDEGLEEDNDESPESEIQSGDEYDDADDDTVAGDDERYKSAAGEDDRGQEDNQLTTQDSGEVQGMLAVGDEQQVSSLCYVACTHPSL